jgi:hypothetical protein
MPAVQRLRMVISEARQLVERCRARLHGWESLGWLPAWVPESLRGPFIMVAASVLNRISYRFAMLAERMWFQGFRPALRASRPKAAGQRRERKPPKPPDPRSPDLAERLLAQYGAAALRMPRDAGWLNWVAPGVSHLRAALLAAIEDPELAWLLAASPDMRRMLRPLCRMMGIEIPDCLRPPPRARPVEPEPQPVPAEPAEAVTDAHESAALVSREIPPPTRPRRDLVGKVLRTRCVTRGTGSFKLA